jgi:hypothetical protein
VVKSAEHLEPVKFLLASINYVAQDYFNSPISLGFGAVATSEALETMN